MINTHLLELPVSRTYFHGPEGFRAIEVLLYLLSSWFPNVGSLLKYWLEETL